MANLSIARGVIINIGRKDTVKNFLVVLPKHSLAK